MPARTPSLLESSNYGTIYIPCHAIDQLHNLFLLLIYPLHGQIKGSFAWTDQRKPQGYICNISLKRGIQINVSWESYTHIINA